MQRRSATSPSVEVAGPGFINLTLERRGLAARCCAPSSPPARLTAAARRAAARKVNVEYVSANPTGPMHVGHGRGAVFGDALANLLAFAGYEVTREYYINDAGAQVDVLARSAFLRYREALGEDDRRDPGGALSRRLPQAGRRGARRASTAAALARHARGANGCRSCATRAIDAMMAMIRDDLAALDIHHDVFFSERSLSQGDGGEVARDDRRAARARTSSTRAACRRRRAQPVEDWEDREQTLFRATAFGDDVDRPLLKSDGTYTYFASDIAYHTIQVRARLRRR